MRGKSSISLSGMCEGCPRQVKGRQIAFCLGTREGCSKTGISKAKGTEAEKNDVEIEIDHTYGLAGERRQRDMGSRENAKPGWQF